MMKRKAASAALSSSHRSKRKKSAISGHDIRGDGPKRGRPPSSSSSSKRAKLPPSLQPIYRPSASSSGPAPPPPKLTRPQSGFAPLSSGSFGPPSAGLYPLPTHPGPYPPGVSAPPPGTTSYPRAGAHWVREPLSRRAVGGHLIPWPVWVEARHRGVSAPAPVSVVARQGHGGGRPVYSSSDEEEEEGEESDGEEGLAADVGEGGDGAGVGRSQWWAPLAYGQAVMGFLQGAKLDAEVERMELKALQKKWTGEGSQGKGRPYVDLEGGSRHMVGSVGAKGEGGKGEGLEKPGLKREWSTSSLGGEERGSKGSGKGEGGEVGKASFTQKDGVWLCGVCERTFTDIGKMQRHASEHAGVGGKASGQQRKMEPPPLKAHRSSTDSYMRVE